MYTIACAFINLYRFEKLRFLRATVKHDTVSPGILQEQVTTKGLEFRAERQVLKRKLTSFDLTGIVEVTS